MRRSTDMLAVEDADLAAAVRFIREHACDGITVADVVGKLPLSRRVLESRFERVLGRTPHAEILRVRLERVKQLLTEGFGWKHVIDLGDITTARGTEAFLPLWLRLWGTLRTGDFNIHVVKR